MKSKKSCSHWQFYPPLSIYIYIYILILICPIYVWNGNLNIYISKSGRLSLETKYFTKERKLDILLFEGLTTVVTVRVTQALYRGPLLELFWTDRRLLFQWPQKKSISAGALSCLSASRRVLSRTSFESIHSFPCWSLGNTTMGQSGSDCLLWDIKAKQPVHPRRSCGQKEQQPEEKRLWTAVPASVYSLSF